MTVRIANPPSGGRSHCGPQHAARYLRQGRARLIAPATEAHPMIIEMIERDHRHRSAVSNSEIELQCGYDKTVAHGSSLTQHQAKGIPFAGDVSRMGLPGGESRRRQWVL